MDTVRANVDAHGRVYGGDTLFFSVVNLLFAADIFGPVDALVKWLRKPRCASTAAARRREFPRRCAARPNPNLPSRVPSAGLCTTTTRT